ncbi:M23 family metallopeptidase [Salmonirosea aquatica]|uniref:Peptidoglycan DD-metalloendopeptidase family protein n=1 Tax=Salmonirosea aquatica TaxID=2654236 RepID=A0A7C9FQP3_9BACT|nr:peptidoglycan DD-metalloendopeptidase family protein [Cytophagaceae bacterium SJW1-29]
MNNYLRVICVLTVSTPIFGQDFPAKSLSTEKKLATKSIRAGKDGGARPPGDWYQQQNEPMDRAFTFLEDIPCISPLEAGESPWISSAFGMRLHPIDRVPKPHLGLDLVCRRGFQFVYATANGQVAFAGDRGGLGLAIEVNHVRGYTTGYGHLGSIFVRVGDQVRIGEVLGVTGSSGKATGIHLHYTVIRNGTAVDPPTLSDSI